MFHQKFTTLAEIPSEHYPYMRLPELKEEPFSQINIASATHFSSPFIISGHLGFIIVFHGTCMSFADCFRSVRYQSRLKVFLRSICKIHGEKLSIELVSFFFSKQPEQLLNLARPSRSMNKVLAWSRIYPRKHIWDWVRFFAWEGRVAGRYM